MNESNTRDETTPNPKSHRGRPMTTIAISLLVMTGLSLALPVGLSGARGNVSSGQVSVDKVPGDKQAADSVDRAVPEASGTTADEPTQADDAPAILIPRPDAPFGPRRPNLDNFATGAWWERAYNNEQNAWLHELQSLPREEAMAFALYTHQNGTLKLTAQCLPLMPDEPQKVTLEFERNEEWIVAAVEPIVYPGWSAHFRVENWDDTQTVKYRVRLGELSSFEGTIRRNPIDRDEIVVGSLSCNSRFDRGGRDRIVAALLQADPDLLFFAGDQSYDHAQHTAAWILFGRQFRDVIRDRPTITIPDDHDIGQGNLWGEGGIAAPEGNNGDAGGYIYPPAYVNMVERCQTWHLPDPFDDAPIEQGIGVYYTSLNVGGVDFAILEDRKFKSGPNGKIPQMGPRPDHINDPEVDVMRLDMPNLVLLGERQHEFLTAWTDDWTNTQIKAVLSQTNFCGAVHLHGRQENRLVADLDSNGWPQSGRNTALQLIRRASAVHLAGDQHLSVVVQHGIETFRDGPYTFVNPAIVNTVYGRWWWPADEQPGTGAPIDNALTWTGDYLDGFRNQITMVAYANPKTENIRWDADPGENGLADGYGIVRFNKSAATITFEAWPRSPLAMIEPGVGNEDLPQTVEQYPGWPVTISVWDNDGRTPVAYLPELRFDIENPVIKIVETDSGEVLYARRIQGRVFTPPVFSDTRHAILVGADLPGHEVWRGDAVPEGSDDFIEVRLPPAEALYD